jgi:ABC-type protease/lipase transport system fused ATPase/permease subunit
MNFELSAIGIFAFVRAKALQNHASSAFRGVLSGRPVYACSLVQCNDKACDHNSSCGRQRIWKFPMTVLNIYNAEKSALKRSLVFVALVSIMASLCLLVVPLYLTQVYDRVIFARNVDTLLAISSIALVVLIAFGFLDAIRTNLLAKIGIRFEAKLSGLLLGAELSRTIGAQRQSLYFLSRIRQAISSTMMTALFDIPVAILFTLLVFAVHPTLGGLILAGMVILAVIAALGEIMTSKVMKEAQEASIAAQKREDAAFRQRELVKSMGIFREVVDDWSREQSKHLTNVLVSSSRTNAFASASRAVRQIIQIAIIGTGAYLVLLDHVTPGIIFAASMIGSRALAPIEMLISGWRSVNMLRMNFKLLDKRMASLNIADENTLSLGRRAALAAEGVAFAWPTTVPASRRLRFSRAYPRSLRKARSRGSSARPARASPHLPSVSSAI